MGGQNRVPSTVSEEMHREVKCSLFSVQMHTLSVQFQSTGLHRYKQTNNCSTPSKCKSRRCSPRSAPGTMPFPRYKHAQGLRMQCMYSENARSAQTKHPNLQGSERPAAPSFRPYIAEVPHPVNCLGQTHKTHEPLHPLGQDRQPATQGPKQTSLL